MYLQLGCAVATASAQMTAEHFNITQQNVTTDRILHSVECRLLQQRTPLKTKPYEPSIVETRETSSTSMYSAEKIDYIVC